MNWFGYSDCFLRNKDCDSDYDMVREYGVNIVKRTLSITLFSYDGKVYTQARIRWHT